MSLDDVSNSVTWAVPCERDRLFFAGALRFGFGLADGGGDIELDACTKKNLSLKGEGGPAIGLKCRCGG
ncbi:hypothetical protein A7R81_17755 [Pseudomonas aeruginosa]|nr:hypothetical protein A7R81_17755 [Pseudomonas aeruginosa]